MCKVRLTVRLSEIALLFSDFRLLSTWTSLHISHSLFPDIDDGYLFLRITILRIFYEMTVVFLLCVQFKKKKIGQNIRNF